MKLGRGKPNAHPYVSVDTGDDACTTVLTMPLES